MTFLRYDERDIVRKLDMLPLPFRVAFAAACAERQFPAYVAFHEKMRRGAPHVLGNTLKRIWEDLLGQAMSANDAAEYLDDCMKLIPREDEEPWVAEQVYAEDAATAVAYALRAWKTGDSQEAAWAARCAYEAVDFHVVNQLDIDLNKPGSEEAVLQHPLMQTELGRQQRDLDDLSAAAATPERHQTLIATLRSRAVEEGFRLFQSPPRGK